MAAEQFYAYSTHKATAQVRQGQQTILYGAEAVAKIGSIRVVLSAAHRLDSLILASTLFHLADFNIFCEIAWCYILMLIEI